MLEDRALDDGMFDLLTYMSYVLDPVHGRVDSMMWGGYATRGSLTKWIELGLRSWIVQDAHFRPSSPTSLAPILRLS